MDIKLDDVLTALSEAQDKLKILDKLMALLGPNGMPRIDSEQEEIYTICRHYWQKYLDFDDSE